MLSVIWNEIAWHEAELKRLRAEIQRIRETCEHTWEPEEGYLFSGFYCRRCGSTK